MTSPDIIPLDSIVLGERGRKTYDGIAELAQSILTVGLIQPIVLETIPLGFLLRAGGRRFHALRLLKVPLLYHAASADPARPGFLLANSETDELRGLLIELAENHDREDIPWQDDMKLIYRAFCIWQRNEHAEGRAALARQFGAMAKVLHQEVAYVKIIHDDVVKYPERYADCNTLTMAYKKYCLITSEQLVKVAATKSLTKIPAKRAKVVIGKSNQAEPEPEPEVDSVIVEISKTILHTNGLDFLASCPPNSFDHIVTDPDYGVSPELLNVRGGELAANIPEGVFFASSFADLERFISLSFPVCRHFCIFFYDLDQHEKLQAIATRVGWCVQPGRNLIWHKTDHRSNAAPQYNFCKNAEYAMVLRKPGAVLARVQTSCIFSSPGLEAQRDFGHPFAKPRDLWSWLYDAIAIRGQSVLDPFAGRGSAPCAALRRGLRPFACEIDEKHYHDLTMNVQASYREVLGMNVRFE